MDMIINGLAGFVALTVFGTFVAQFFAPMRRSALWSAPAAAPILGSTPEAQLAGMDVPHQTVDLDARRRAGQDSDARPVHAHAA